MRNIVDFIVKNICGGAKIVDNFVDNYNLSTKLLVTFVLGDFCKNDPLLMRNVDKKYQEKILAILPHGVKMTIFKMAKLRKKVVLLGL